MSRSKKGAKSPGYEYWSRRPNSMSSPGKVAKQITTSKERSAAKAVERKVKRDKDDS